jgi:hypothetical protein
MKKTYHVAAIWDPESSVWVSETDIPGLVIEAETLAQFEQLMDALAPEMLAANTNLHNQSVGVDLRAEGRREFAVA